MEGRGEAWETSFTPLISVHYLHASVSDMHAVYELLHHVVYITLIVSTRATAESVTSHACITPIILSGSAAYDDHNPLMQFPPPICNPGHRPFCRYSPLCHIIGDIVRQLYIPEAHAICIDFLPIHPSLM